MKLIDYNNKKFCNCDDDCCRYNYYLSLIIASISGHDISWYSGILMKWHG